MLKDNGLQTNPLLFEKQRILSLSAIVNFCREIFYEKSYFGTVAIFHGRLFFIFSESVTEVSRKEKSSMTKIATAFNYAWAHKIMHPIALNDGCLNYLWTEVGDTDYFVITKM